MSEELKLYIWKLSDNTIASVGTTPFVLGTGETQEEILVEQQTEMQGEIEVIIETPEQALLRAMGEYAGRLILSANKSTILADDTDEVIVTVQTSTAASSIDVDVNGVPVTVTITGGSGELPPITADTPGEIVIKPADETAYSAAGQGGLVIIAEDV